MFNLWPYLLRLSVALYFIYPHINNLLLGIKKVNSAMFACLNAYMPQTIAFTLWNGFFIILGLIILIWPRPIFPLIIAFVVLACQLYLNFSVHTASGATNMLLFILSLVTLALIIYHSRPQFR